MIRVGSVVRDHVWETGRGNTLQSDKWSVKWIFQIYKNHEVYLTDLDHDEVPALFWWFPNQDDYQPPPPADETVVEKLERISNTLKVG